MFLYISFFAERMKEVAVISSSEGGGEVGEGDSDQGGGQVLDMGPRIRAVVVAREEVGGGPHSLRRATARRYKSRWSNSTTRNSNLMTSLTSGRYLIHLSCFVLVPPRNQRFRFQNC